VADGRDDRGESKSKGERDRQRVEGRAGDLFLQGGGRRDGDAREEEDEGPD
jgi:hypothetical protein